MEALRVTRRLELPAEELQVSFARAGGPGGQNVNKVETKVCLRFSVAESRALSEEQRATLQRRLGARLTTAGEVLVQAARHRERARNLEDARERLAQLLRDALTEPKRRKPTRPTRGSVERRLKAKQQRSQTKRRRRGEIE